MVGAFYIFFIEKINLSTIFISTFLFIMFLLFGIEKIIEKDKKLGYAYVVTSLVVFSGVLLELIRG